MGLEDGSAANAIANAVSTFPKLARPQMRKQRGAARGHMVACSVHILHIVLDLNLHLALLGKRVDDDAEDDVEKQHDHRDVKHQLQTRRQGREGKRGREERGHAWGG